jgi:hypothetical protein
VLYPVSLVLNKQEVAGRPSWLRTLLEGALPAIKRAYLADPIAIGILGYRSGLLHGGANPLVVTADTSQAHTQTAVRAAEAAAAVASTRMQHEFIFSDYVLIAAGIALLTAIIGQLIFRRLAPSFAERG